MPYTTELKRQVTLTCHSYSRNGEGLLTPFPINISLRDSLTGQILEPSPSISLRDSLTGQILEMDSRKQDVVKIYNCGLTVYDRAHIGHAKEIVIFDVLRRVLIAKGFKVVYVQNFTDVDDRIINKARESHLQAKDIAEKYINEYFADFEKLNIMKADHHPRATEHIETMIEIIDSLLKKGYAYISKSGVYYDVARFKEYGKLSKKGIEELRAGYRIEPDPFKRDPADFALWKFYDDEPLWDSPWGKGRPGWHIECSAMIDKILGEPIDIHGGGEDLIFPHHENEIAQSEAYAGKILARIWMHAGLLRIKSVKMSKSLGNFIPVSEAVARFGSNTVRYYLLSAHYRKQLDFDLDRIAKANENWRVIESAANYLSYSKRNREVKETISQPKQQLADKLQELIQKFPDIPQVLEIFASFDKSLSYDLDTPSALASMLRISRYVNRLAGNRKLTQEVISLIEPVFYTMFYILGFKLPLIDDVTNKRIEAQVAERNSYRAKGDFLQADKIRDDLAKEGILLIDMGDSTVWYRTEIMKRNEIN
ncbi:MAG: cysteine--tRNA ligase [Conexivisphaerales archaeon]